MSVEEMKIEIIDKVIHLSEEKLNQVNDFIRSINERSLNTSNILNIANDIINERSKVLEKLAE